jgi:hypothetical protein
MFVDQERHDDLDAVRRLIETGQVTPVVDRAFPVGEVPDALRYLETGQARARSPWRSESQARSQLSGICAVDDAPYQWVRSRAFVERTEGIRLRSSEVRRGSRAPAQRIDREAT